MPTELVSAFDTQMWQTRARRYANLDWVTNGGPMQHLLDIANLHGDEIIVDVGTGSLAVAKSMSEHLHPEGRVIAFDISREMLDLGKKDCASNVIPFVAMAENIPLSSDSAGLVIARMVYHHLPDPSLAIKEGARILKPGGRFFVAEHVVLDEEVRNFERPMFDAKEPGRHLWTTGEIENLLNQGGLINVQSFAGMIEQYSMTEWMRDSGLNEQIQKGVLTYFNSASESVRNKLRINFSDKDEIFMDGYYACVVGQKPE